MKSPPKSALPLCRRCAGLRESRPTLRLIPRCLLLCFCFFSHQRLTHKGEAKQTTHGQIYWVKRQNHTQFMYALFIPMCTVCSHFFLKNALNVNTFFLLMICYFIDERNLWEVGVCLSSVCIIMDILCTKTKSLFTTTSVSTTRLNRPSVTMSTDTVVYVKVNPTCKLVLVFNVKWRGWK